MTKEYSYLTQNLVCCALRHNLRNADIILENDSISSISTYRHNLAGGCISYD